MPITAGIDFLYLGLDGVVARGVLLLNISGLRTVFRRPKFAYFMS